MLSEILFYFFLGSIVFLLGCLSGYRERLKSFDFLHSQLGELRSYTARTESAIEELLNTLESIRDDTPELPRNRIQIKLKEAISNYQRRTN